jgi:predicted lipid-binding transport protein (Tim44 family)
MTEAMDMNSNLYLVGLFLFYWLLFNLASQSVPSGNEDSAEKGVAMPDTPQPDMEAGHLPAALEAIGKADRNFTRAHFLAAAANAHEIILDAFAAGDEMILGPLVGPDVLTAFVDAIDERRKRSETLDLIVVGEKEATIVDAGIVDGMADITVRFVTDIVKATRSEVGKMISGDLNHIIETCDIWTFSRDLSSRDPSWRLTVTSNAQSLAMKDGAKASSSPRRSLKAKIIDKTTRTA